MSYSTVSYVGDGTTTTFAVPFPYLSQDHVSATVDFAAVTLVWLTPATVQVTPAPAVGSTLKIRRTTPITGAPVVFIDGGTITATDLNAASLQSTYALQENLDEHDFFYNEALTVTATDTLSLLTNTPNGNFCLLTVNGQSFPLTAGSYALHGRTITWSPAVTGFSLQPGWSVTASYTFSE